jgi:hypothetical protein
MTNKSILTNEQLNKRFGNPFALVNHAIRLAKLRIQKGEGLDENPANDVLELIARGLDTEDEEPPPSPYSVKGE